MFEIVTITLTLVAAMFFLRMARRFDTQAQSGRYFLSVVVAATAWGIGLAIAAAMSSSAFKAFIGPLYIAQVCLLIYLYGSFSHWTIRDMLRPSMLCVMYLGLSAGLGAIIYNLGAVVIRADYANYLSWQEMQILYAAVSGTFLALFTIAISGQATGSVLVDTPGNRSMELPAAGVFCATLFVSLLWDNPFAPVIWTVLASATFFLAFRRRFKWRWLLVAIVVTIVSIVSFESKRNAIFLLLPAVLLETQYGMLKMNWRWIVRGALLGGIAVILVLTMSQLRAGSGKGFIEALLNVPSYISSKDSLKFISNNFELGYIFYHLHNAVGIALFQPYVQTGGETYLKALFVGIPPGLLSYKPPSFIELYTSFTDPAFRDIGGSWAATTIGEAFWNFGVGGLAGLSGIFYLLDRLYRALIIRISRYGVISAGIILAFIEFILLFIRGSGLDYLVAYSYVAAGATMLIVVPVALLFGLYERPARSGARRLS